MKVVRLKGVSVLEQLRLEEALLRTNEENWCVMNSGSPEAIVMGISGKKEIMIDEKRLEARPVPVIKRFSGGGTVFVDPNTLFITFICNRQDVGVPCFPKEVLKWTEKIYRPVFPQFEVRENDYTIGDRKFGGNAQYMQKERWLHHSTLLWDFDPEQMHYLQLPPKMPKYREERGHSDFLCCLKKYIDHPDRVEERLIDSLSRFFTLSEANNQEIETVLNLPHRKATKSC